MGSTLVAKRAADYLRWSDPPKPTRDNGGAYIAILAELKKHPGEFAEVSDGVRASLAKHGAKTTTRMVTRLENGKPIREKRTWAMWPANERNPSV